MALDVTQAREISSQSDATAGRIDSVDPRQKALATGLEFTRRAFEAPTPDDLYLMLTNDIRALVEFDRCVLIVHLGGASRLVSASNQATLTKTSKFYELTNESAGAFKGVKTAVLLGRNAAFPEMDAPETARIALKAYMEFGEATYLFCVPLVHADMTVGHLLFEFLEENVPDQIGVLTVLNISPLISAAIVEKWLLKRRPALISLMDPVASALKDTRRLKRLGIRAGIVALLLVALIFVIPFPVSVGGEAEIVPTDRHVAFAQIPGLLQTVRVREGDLVEKDQILATLDPKELDYKIQIQEKQVEILTAETNLLKNAGTEDPAKLAESNLSDLKRRSAWAELQYLKWQRQFLDIKAPVNGVVVTKDVESLSGKRLKAGEPLCELVIPGDLSCDVFVPEDKVTYVKQGQTMTTYLAGSPTVGHVLEVKEIAPMAEAVPRLGNVYRVKAPFPDAAAAMIGMKGIGRINAGHASLWRIVHDRLLSKWQSWAIHF
jgi:multidrug resistance efflux pump